MAKKEGLKGAVLMVSIIKHYTILFWTPNILVISLRHKPNRSKIGRKITHEQ